MRLVPQHEVLAKLAAVQSADLLGRQLAQDAAVEKLAGMAGVFMAHARTEGGIDKLAQSMVYSGGLSSEEYDMLKEAGYFGVLAKRFGRTIKSKAVGAAGAVAKGATGVKSRVGSVLKRTPKPDPALARQSRDWAAKPKPKMSPNAAYNKQRGAPGQPAASTPGRVAPAPQTAPAPKQAPSTQQMPQPAPKSSSSGMGWGRALPWVGAAGLGYGLYKGVPWAARQLEATSTTPLAYGGGWSPVPYGYGYSPYGPGMPTMGMGA